MISEGLRSANMIGYKDACQYIDRLYGYKNYEQLCDYIKDRFDGADVSVKGSTFRISFGTDAIKDFYRPDTDVLREIGNYSRNIAKVSMVIIIIKNIAPNDKGNAVETLKHSISMEYHQWTYEEKRRSGMSYKSKGEYYNFYCSKV